MPSNMGCVTPQKLTNNREVQARRTADELDDIERRVDELDRNLAEGSQADPASERFKNQARFSFRTKLKSAMRLVSSKFLSQGDELGLNYLNTWLAKNFAVWKRFGQLGSEATPAGDVRQMLKRAERVFTNDLPHNLGRLAIEERIRANWQEMQALKKSHGIKDSDFNKLATLAVELSYSRWAKQYYNVGAKGLEFIRGRFDRFMKYMDELGLRDSEKEYVLQLGREVADSYHQALRIAQEMGVNVNKLENMEFFPRQLSEDIKRRFAWERQEGTESTLRSRGDAQGSITLNDGSTIDLGQAFMKSRNTYNFIVEDEIVLQAFLEANRFFELDEIKAMDDVNHVNDLLDPDKGNVMNKALFDNLKTNQLEALIDSGILSKIPMTSPEYQRWLNNKFPLPSRDLATLIQTDWKKAFDGYREQLKRATGRSGMVWTLVANATGIDGNKAPWGITKKQKFEDMKLPRDKQQFRNWKPLFTENDPNSSVLTPEMEEMFVRSKVDKQGEIPQVYVHPIASKMFSSMIDIAEDPGKLGVIAEQLRNFTSAFKDLAVTSSQFLFTQFVSVPFQMWTAGGDFSRYGSDVTKFMNIMSLVHDRGWTLNEAIADQLDDTRSVYRGQEGRLVTEKELYEQGRRLGFLNDYVPGIGEQLGNTNQYLGFSPGNIKGNIRVMSANMNQLGMWRGSAQNMADSVSSIKRMALDPFSQRLMLLTNEFENAGRFGTLKTLTFDRKQGNGFLDNLQKAKKVATTQRVQEFETLEGAVEHAQNYFFMFDDQGKLDVFMRDFVVPFWSYVSRNPVAQVRGMIRNPVKYGNWLRLYGATNGRERTEEKVGQPVENFVPQWVRENRPIYWTVNEDETPDEESRPFVFYFPSRQVDPVGDAFETITNVGDWALSKAGIDGEKFAKGEIPTKEELKFVQGENEGTVIENILSNTYGTYKGVLGAVMQREIGQDAESLVPNPGSRTQETFFGVKFDPRLKYLIEETIPIAQRLNSANPGGIFGRRGGFVISDSGEGIELVEAKESIFGAPRSDFDRQAYMDDVASRMQSVYGRYFTGVNYLDPMYNTAKSVSDLKDNLQELEQQIQFHKEEIQSTTNVDKVRRLQMEVESMLATHAKMLDTMNRVKDWADKNGLRPMEAYRFMRRNQITPPPTTPEGQKKAIKETLERSLQNTEQDVKEQL